MADIWEIAAYVEEHPDDHPQRWRLAKKFYADHEYRHALDHLNVLKHEWTPKLNVRRYLAATYYRLGRYEEAAAELEEALGEWPDDLGLREQLAHIYQADGKLERALEVWEYVLKRFPDNAMAQKAANKIKVSLAFKQPPDTQDKQGSFSSDPGELGVEEDSLPMPGAICSKCGARNSDEFESCWRCGQAIQLRDAAFFNTPSIEAHGPLLLRPETIGFAALLLLFGLLATIAWLGVLLFLRYQDAADMPMAAMADIYDQVLAPSRIATGIGLLIIWPLVLQAVLRLFRVVPTPPSMLVYLAGLILSAVTFFFLLLPAPMIIPGIALPLLFSLGMLLVGAKLNMSKALSAWMVQALVVGILGASIFWLTECRMFGALFNPVTEAQAIHAYMSDPNFRRDVTPVRLPNAITPIRQKVRWRATGSDWLDARASKVSLVLRLEAESPTLRFQIYEGSDLRCHEEVGPSQNTTILYNVIPNTVYEIVVAGEENNIAQVIVQSPLTVEFLD